MDKGIRSRSILETSPRVWGEQSHRCIQRLHQGNIPTCVGRTVQLVLHTQEIQKHPHVCGENTKKVTKIQTLPFFTLLKFIHFRLVCFKKNVLITHDPKNSFHDCFITRIKSFSINLSIAIIIIINKITIIPKEI